MEDSRNVTSPGEQREIQFNHIDFQLILTSWHSFILDLKSPNRSLFPKFRMENLKITGGGGEGSNIQLPMSSAASATYHQSRAAKKITKLHSIGQAIFCFLPQLLLFADPPIHLCLSESNTSNLKKFGTFFPKNYNEFTKWIYHMGLCNLSLRFCILLKSHFVYFWFHTPGGEYMLFVLPQYTMFLLVKSKTNLYIWSLRGQ